MRPDYRSDIDGLRAIAVLLVVVFHAFPKYAPAGFIGVDIFFVISGFLISTLIYKDFNAGSFTLIGFYGRRIRRIFPALVVVVVSCTLVGAFILFPDEYRSLGIHIAGGAGFASNFLLLSETGYFDEAADLKPLLHLWSLGIEEQFYLVWPAVILLCARWRKDPFAVAALVFLGSFAWNVILSKTSPSAAFFLPTTRFWELMLGCLLASLVSRDQPHAGGFFGFRPLGGPQGPNIREVTACGGIALLMLSAVLIDKGQIWPGWWALLPTGATALLIVAGPTTIVARNILSNRVLVYIGLISFPLYLWHWPLLSFARIFHIREPTVLVKIAVVVAAFGLAAFTYQFIERPIRFGRPTSVKIVGSAVALGAAACIGFLIYVNAGFPQRYSPTARNLVPAPISPVATGCQQAKKDSVVLGAACYSNDKSDAPRVVLWGDSHASDLHHGFQDIRGRLGIFDLSTYFAHGCPPILSFNSAQAVHCRSFNDFVFQEISKIRPRTVVMAGRWELYRGINGWGLLEDDAIRSTISRLKSMGVSRVVVIGQLPLWFGSPWRIRARLLRTEPLRLLSGKIAIPVRDKSYLRPSTIQSDERMRAAVSGTGAIFVSPITTLCNRDGCLLVPDDGSDSPIGRDADGHLTPIGSRYFVDTNSSVLFEP